ncbi:MAG: hypothetical protein AAF149_18270 [Bacteroidota bacterium]
MIKAQVNFFHFAGSLIGGIIFLGSALIGFGTIVYLHYPSQFQTDYLSSIFSIGYGTFLLSLALVVGYIISSFSVKYYFDKAKKRIEYRDFMNDFSEVLGFDLPGLNNKGSSVALELQVHLAFAQSVGHPISLYDLAGRGRLAGSSAFNGLWIFLVALGVLLTSFFSQVSTESAERLFIVSSIVAIFGLSLFITGHMIAIRSWTAYLTRRDIHSVFKYQDSGIVQTSDLKNIVSNAKNLYNFKSQSKNTV